MNSTARSFEVVCDGSVLFEHRAGGWAAQIRDRDDADAAPRMLTGAGRSTDSTEVEMRAILLGLQAVPTGSKVRLLSDRQDLVAMLREAAATKAGWPT